MLAEDEKPSAPRIEHDESVTSIQSQPPPDSSDEVFQWTPKVIMHLVSMYSTYFSIQWGLAVPGYSVAFIQRWDPANANIATWIAALPGLVLCVFSLFLGDLADTFGQRWFILLANGFGLLGALIVGRAEDIPMGIGGMVPGGLAVAIGFLTMPSLAEAVPKRSRTYIMGIASVAIGIVGIGGTVVMGAAMELDAGGLNQGWRVAFYVSAGFYALSMVLCALFFHPAPRQNPGNLTKLQKLAKVDWIGMFVGGGGLTLFLVALKMGGIQYPWNSATVLSLLVLGFVMLVFYAVWQKYLSKNPIFTAELFANINFPIVLCLSFIHGFGLFGIAAFINQEVLALLTSNYILSSVYVLPFAVGGMIGAAITAWVTFRTKEFRFVSAGAAAAMTIGGGLFAVMNPGINFAAWFFPCFLCGMSAGALGAIVPTLATISTPNQLIATSVTLAYSAKGLGGAVGVVIFSSIFISKITKLPDQVASAVVRAGLPPTSVGPLLLAISSGNETLFQSIPGVTREILETAEQSSLQATANAYRYIWFSLVPFGALVFLVTWFIRSSSTSMTSEVAYKMKGSGHLKDQLDLKLEKADDL